MPAPRVAGQFGKFRLSSFFREHGLRRRVEAGDGNEAGSPAHLPETTKPKPAMNPTLKPPTASIPVGDPDDPRLDLDENNWNAFRAELGAEGEEAVRSILQNPGGDPAEVMDLQARLAHAGKGGVR
jgi:hypothetical protein